MNAVASPISRVAEDPAIKGRRGMLTRLAYIAAGASLLAIGAFVARFWTQTISDDPARWGQFGDYLGGVLNPFVALLTFGTILFTVLQNEALTRSAHAQAQAAQSAHAFDRSARQLDAALAGMRRALDLLTDGNNDRLTWIQAARILAASERIADGITEATHRDMLEVALFDLRNLAGKILGHDDERKSAGFFYGAPLDPKGHVTLGDLDEAARQSSVARENARRQLSDVQHLDEHTLYVFWKFAQFPTDFADPIGKHEFDALVADDSIQLHLWPGLRAYLGHRKRYRSIGGKLVELGKGTAAGQ